MIKAYPLNEGSHPRGKAMGQSPQILTKKMMHWGCIFIFEITWGGRMRDKDRVGGWENKIFLYILWGHIRLSLFSHAYGCVIFLSHPHAFLFPGSYTSFSTLIIRDNTTCTWCEDTPFLDHFFKLLFGHVLTEYDSQIMCNVCNYPLVKKHPWIGSIFPTIYVKAMDKGPCKLRDTFFPTFLVLIKWVSSSLRGVPYATFHEFWYVFIL